MKDLSDHRWMIATAGLLVALIAMFVLLPVTSMDSILKPLNQLIYDYAPGIGVSAGKVGHVIAFFLLGLCGLKLRSIFGFHWLWLAAAMVGFSVFTELLQLMIDGRTTRFRDFLFDILGVSLALLVYCSVQLLKSVLRALKQRGSSSATS